MPFGFGRRKVLLTKYQETVPLEQRIVESNRVRERHPDRVPVICEKIASCKFPPMEKSKFLVPADLTVGQFIHMVSSRIQVTAYKSVFLFTATDSMPSNSTMMHEVYSKHQSEDGFLYLWYHDQETFG